MSSVTGHHKDDWCHYVYLRYPKLKKRIEAEQAAVWANKPDDDKFEIKRAGAFGGRNTYGPLLVMLRADKQAVLVRASSDSLSMVLLTLSVAVSKCYSLSDSFPSKVMHEVVNLILAEGNKGVSTLKACINVAELVQAEVRLFPYSYLKR